MPIVEISETKVFHSALQSTSGLVVIDFFAPWCGPCRALAPTLMDIVNTFPKVLVIKVDVDILNDVASTFDVSRLPTIVYVRNGREIDRVVGSDRGAIAAKVIAHSG